ncbi:MAG TPA: nucleotidyltransferase [Phycisphaerales bacterium]|nr:nucleotidyltransferase [Phycisphaerales bacterium]
MSTPRIPIPQDALARLCQRWMITEFALFGSVLRDDFGPESDVDVLVSFAPEAQWTYFQVFNLQDELERLLGRRIDLLTRRSVERHHNPWLRHAILRGATVVFPAA